MVSHSLEVHHEGEGTALAVTDHHQARGRRNSQHADSTNGREHHPAGKTAAGVGHTGAVRLLTVLVLNLIIPTAQVALGVRAHSVALISDAAHNFSDFTALLIAYIANRIARKGASLRNTFGYRRAEILGALINATLLTAIAAFIIYEAIERLSRLERVTGPLVILAAGIGVLGNGLSAWLLHRDSKHNLNMRGAFLHMVGDLLGPGERDHPDLQALVLARPGFVHHDRRLHRLELLAATEDGREHFDARRSKRS